MAKLSEQIILEAASHPPKRLREFWPFLLPVGLIALLLAAHAVLFWISWDYSESGLYLQRDGRYVELYSGVRELVLGMSFLTIICFALMCVLAQSLWRHKKVIHELWKKTQDSA